MNIGMDYFGPIYVKIGWRREKDVRVIFTCLAVRAILLEISHSLNSDSAIMIIIILLDEEENLHSTFCDNGTNFVAAA